MTLKWNNRSKNNETSPSSKHSPSNSRASNNSPANNNQAGNFGAIIEQKACHWLQQQGLEYIEKNYHCRAGEIDLIMQQQQYLVFIEVRYRKHNRYGDGLESVDWRKQQKLNKAAKHFLQQRNRYQSWPCRFDVLAVRPITENSATLHWTWIKNAF
ncbi:MAG: putative endonuclease [Oceanicoccus sp.]|jgi:putative endonuclease